VARGWDALRTPGSPPVLAGNSFGLFEAVLGYVAGFVAAEVGLAIYGALAHRHDVTGYATDIAGLVGLWVGFLSGALIGVRRAASPPATRAWAPRVAISRFRDAYGLAFRPIDLPLGIVAGLAAQYVVVPLAELPLVPFVPHLFHRLSGPANSITGGVTGAGLVVLCLLICIGTPLFEELYFRGLILRGLLDVLQRREWLGERLPVVLAVLASSIIFGFAHFELLELPGLIGAGVVFGTLAVLSRRLGPGMVAHATFNAVTLIAIVHSR
jgi:membrane protease YdiL (CAAX protease family)